MSERSRGKMPARPTSSLAQGRTPSLLSCAEAVAACLGCEHGCEYLHEAARHPHVEDVIRAAITEAKAALKAEFPRQADAIDRDADDALERLTKVAERAAEFSSTPPRALTPPRCLVGPARLASRHGLPHDNLRRAIAQDVTADALADGAGDVLAEHCGILPLHNLARAVKQHPAEEASSATTVYGEFGGSIGEFVHGVSTALGRRYDGAVVSDVIARVIEHIQDARQPDSGAA
jgi:hypothetical protein